MVKLRKNDYISIFDTSVYKYIDAQHVICRASVVIKFEI